MIGKKDARWRRKMRIRKKIHGAPERPRLSVYRSNLHIYAQLIDDRNGVTLAAISTLSPQYKERQKDKEKKDAAKIVGALIAELAKAKGIEQIVFDRNRYRYHGRVRALADGAREGGLKF
ncbi:MAG: 50S ribosomal protein L18 [Candidatus Aureabacteria bacterium]|nr:50S ribosomal protein L18 [Candidatus Auribacterota bacterium]